MKKLWAVQQTFEAFGFTPVADPLLTGLSTDGRTSVGVGRRIERSFRESEALKDLCILRPTPFLAQPFLVAFFSAPFPFSTFSFHSFCSLDFCVLRLQFAFLSRSLQPRVPNAPCLKNRNKRIFYKLQVCEQRSLTKTHIQSTEVQLY